jgi:hypothetical protein
MKTEIHEDEELTLLLLHDPCDAGFLSEAKLNIVDVKPIHDQLYIPSFKLLTMSFSVRTVNL